jgi:type I restriction enzyme, R subunit
MSKVGSIEIVTQKRLLKVFENDLDYDYLGDWQDREGNSNVEEEILTDWLKSQGHEVSIIRKVLTRLEKQKSIGGATQLYDANRAVYDLLRYGVKVQSEVGEQKQTVWLIDWNNPENNHFAVAEEVTITGKPNTKRPDIVIYVNGIALGIIELKRSTVTVSEGIRQNLVNQKKEFIQHFFSTIQLVFAGNDTEGLRHGVIGTPERFFLKWKEEGDIEIPLDRSVVQMCEKHRFLELIHDFIVFDAGIKKTCRTNQYFGTKATREFCVNREGGIVWHTQGSGKSLIMVWLAKWLRENVKDARVLILTDRTELDEQIEKVFKGVNEDIHRTTDGADLITSLNTKNDWLMCSLIHKFGSSDKEETEAFIEDIKSKLPNNFSAKGEMFVIIDECHRTQSGRMHRAMKEILSDNVTIIGFTGTPLIQTEKKSTLETFGPYIHTYKYDEAVADKVILDLRYEARKIDQTLSSPGKVDQWFEHKTEGLNDVAKAKLKRRWGTLQKVFSAEDRLKVIARDILFDMEMKERLNSGKGNAMLVASGIPEACRYYNIFKETLGEKCAIVTSYEPSTSQIKGEESGEGETQNVMMYDAYTNMLANWFQEPEEVARNKAKEFETQVKKIFVNEPGRMKLLIVVDKLLTGFDAPSATYLYIDKSMQDHGLFQAICRVNRLDDDSKEYGYIVDYKDLFNSIEDAFNDFTGDAFDGYAKEDVEGLLKGRLEMAKLRLQETLEEIRALCEPVEKPHETAQYMDYFCKADYSDEEGVKVDQEKRTKLYKLTRSLIRTYAEIASDISSLFDPKSAAEIKKEIKHYEKLYEEIQVASGDYIDMKMYESGMRHLIDSYIRADDSETISSFDDLSLIQLLVKEGHSAIDSLPDGIKNSRENVAEVIRSNVRRLIVDRQSVNPAYYDKMSSILNDLIERAKTDVEDYEEYLEKLIELAKMVENPETSESYPNIIRTEPQRSMYDNLGNNEVLAIKVDKAIIESKKDGWKNNLIKTRIVRNAIKNALLGTEYEDQVDIILNIAREQSGY